MKKTNTKLFILGIIVCVLVYLGYSYTKFIKTPLDINDENKVSFLILKQTTPSYLADKLEEKGIISNSTFFLIHLKLNNLDKTIKTGRFYFSKSQSPKEIAETLTNSQAGEIIFTIPEGYTIEDIDKKLVKEGFIKENEFHNCIYSTCTRPDYPEIPNSGSLEGYLFPDTYYLNPGEFTPQSFLNRLINNFHNKWETVDTSASNRSAQDIITMASILEKEVRTDPDRPLVAGILWKRLDSQWALGADATIIYATKNLNINAADLKIKSPYNTRKFLGLPPTAICNPGLKSLTAAANPEDSNNWFYLTEPGTGRVIYSYSNEEHNRNKVRYLSQ
ncbi:endolytic transglycosylase MltG [Patescibacteria group bacterium]|nr:endolytic transglycosylase MltG [Patescibacteria group bacterium]